MEASKCPKCGDEPHFVEQIEKWYCYGCNSYIEEEGHHIGCESADAKPHEAEANEIAEELRSLEEDDLPTCKKCGATLETMQDGKLVCTICECPQDIQLPPSGADEKSDSKQNEAQALLDSITVATPVEPHPEPLAVESVERKEPHPEIKMCPSCGQPLKYIEKYKRHYCYGCRKYASKEVLDKTAVVAKPEPPATKKCPDCGKELSYVEKYSEFYCHSCKKYPLRVQKKPHDLKCPKCGGQLRLIEKYSRHYCIACKEYAPKGHGDGPSEKKACPRCKEQMKYVSEYNEWYCYKCKKYSLRPNKPALLV